MARMRILTREGVVDVDVHTQAGRSAVGGYWNAIQAFLATGDTDRLNRYEATVVADRLLLTDPGRIEELAMLGEIDVDDIYEDQE